MFVLLLAKISFMPVVWTLLGICAAAGLLAVVSPKKFHALTNHSNTWVDSNKFLETLDKRVDIDKYVLPFSRVLGVSVLIAVGVLAYLYIKYPVF